MFGPKKIYVDRGAKLHAWSKENPCPKKIHVDRGAKLDVWSKKNLC